MQTHAAPDRHALESVVLLVGATGAFGERLADGLIHYGIAVIALARTTSRLEKLAQRLSPGVSFEVRDRADVDVAYLDALRAKYPGLFAIADASGPFQTSDLGLPRAAIGAGLHYIDLADSRDFVRNIDRLDSDARAADVAVLSGASSTPALSHAVLDRLVADAREVIAVEVGIAPGNRAPRGLSVVQSILSTVGQPIRVFRSGCWTRYAGWTLGKTIELPGLGERRVALCETPDLDLLVSRYRPTQDAMFRAGLELPLMHQSVAGLGLLVQLGYVKTLLPLARPLRALAGLLEPFGSDRGGMQVETLVETNQGRLVRRVWTLLAETGVGPYVPTLPILAALKMLADGTMVWRGAAPCVGIIPYENIAREFDRHAIRTGQDETMVPLPQMTQMLGDTFDILPAGIKAAHDVRSVLVLDGAADATGPETIITSLLSRLFRFPRRGLNMPLRVEMRREADGSETWTRIYPDVTMRSSLRNIDTSKHQLDEVFGPIAIRLQWKASEKGLTLHAVGARLFGIPLPGFLRPRSRASESIDGAGCFHFDVAIALPLIGPIVSYRGHLKPSGDGRGSDNEDGDRGERSLSSRP